MYKINMKIFPILLLGMLIIPESIVHVPIFPFAKADAHPIHMDHNEKNANVSTSQGGLECDACMFLANGLNQTILHNPKVLAIVTEDLEKICAVLPDSVQALCTNAAQQTAPLLLNHLGDFIATEGCSDLGVCHSSHSSPLIIRK
jgi:hypothetical protein